MFFKALMIGGMLWHAYSDYFADYRAHKHSAKSSIARLKPMNFYEILNNPQNYIFTQAELQALAAVKRVANKLSLDERTIIINFGEIPGLACVLDDQIIAIDSDFTLKVPSLQQQEFVIAHELGHIHYKHCSKSNSLEWIVPVCLEVVLAMAYIHGCSYVYHPEEKPKESFLGSIIKINIAQVLLCCARGVSVFLLLRLLGRRDELRADAWAAKKLRNPQAGIDSLKSTPQADPAYFCTTKNSTQQSYKQRLKKCWLDFKKNLGWEFYPYKAFCLTLMPHWSSTHPDHAKRIAHLQTLKIL